MLSALLNALFGCSHRRTSFPITTARKSGKNRATYVVCLDCGTEFEYDWREMRVCKAVKVVPSTGIQEGPLRKCAVGK